LCQVAKGKDLRNLLEAACLFAVTHETKIEELLRLKGWSVTELARKAELSQSATDRLKKRIPKTARIALRLAHALDVPPEWLYDDSKGWPPPKNCELPIFSITPWPPYGITWQEVQYAIATYVARH
jgi:lambda repressor-like predicted transcriptional regulator